MAKRAEIWTLSSAYGYFGAVAFNLAGRGRLGSDGKTVVLNWWKDQVIHESGRLIYDNRSHPRLEDWHGQYGNRDRIRNLLWAREHCDSLFRIVWCEARDPNAAVRKMMVRYPTRICG